MTHLIVFSDLDGTLLDHETYSFEPAIPAVNAIKKSGGMLVLASSKTASEMAPIHAALGLGDAPLIVENGAAIVSPDAIGNNMSQYRAIRSLLQSLNAPFRGFGDMSTKDVCALTGLGEAAAKRARARQFSEPGIWNGTQSELSRFIAALGRNGITARSGGRFMTLSFGSTKADQMDEVMRRHGPARTIALGDAPNDVEMLANADTGVVIRNDSGPGIPPLEDETHIIRTTEHGPEGWNAAVLSLLAEHPQLRGTALNG